MGQKVPSSVMMVKKVARRGQVRAVPWESVPDTVKVKVSLIFQNPTLTGIDLSFNGTKSVF